MCEASEGVVVQGGLGPWVSSDGEVDEEDAHGPDVVGSGEVRYVLGLEDLVRVCAFCVRN